MCGRISSFERRAPRLLRLLETARSDEAVPAISQYGSKSTRLRPRLPKFTNYGSDDIKLFRNVHLIEEQPGIGGVIEASEILSQDPSHPIASKYLGWSLLQTSSHSIDAVMDAIRHLNVSIASGNSRLSSLAERSH